MQGLLATGLVDAKLHRHERSVVDRDPAFFDWGHQEVLVPFPLEHRGEQLDQGEPADRGLEVEPGAVGGDAHVEIAAKWRIPEVHRGCPFRRRPAYGAGDGVEPGWLCLPFLRHGFTGTLGGEWPFSTRS